MYEWGRCLPYRVMSSGNIVAFCMTRASVHDARSTMLAGPRGTDVTERRACFISDSLPSSGPWVWALTCFFDHAGRA